jgi:hypothetical protein
VRATRVNGVLVQIRKLACPPQRRDVVSMAVDVSAALSDAVRSLDAIRMQLIWAQVRPIAREHASALRNADAERVVTGLHCDAGWRR